MKKLKQLLKLLKLVFRVFDEKPSSCTTMTFKGIVPTTQGVKENAKKAPSTLKHVVRVHSKHIDSKKANTSKFWRLDIVAITNQENGRTIFRQVVGPNSTAGLTHETVGLDYNMTDELAITDKANALIEVRSDITAEERFMYFWNHPDAGVALGFNGRVLGIIGLFLGLIGVLLGVFSFVLTIISIL